MARILAVQSDAGPVAPPVLPKGWQIDLATPRRSPLVAAALLTYVSTHPLANIPTVPTPHGWEGQQLEVRFAKPFPTTAQQFAAFQPQGIIRTVFPDGFRGAQYDYQFAKPFPVSAQQFLIHQVHLIPTGPPPKGWTFFHDFAYAKPFPVSAQQFNAHQPQGEVPPNLPPGAGRRKDFPSYIPQPPYEVRARQPYRPVWDRPGEVEQHPVPPAPEPARPVPLPPPALFTTKPSAELNLPRFDHLVPPDSVRLGRQLREAMDLSDATPMVEALRQAKDEQDLLDAVTVLKALGLMPK